jgi:hypothetical protein
MASIFRDFQQTTRRYIPEDCSIHYSCLNFNNTYFVLYPKFYLHIYVNVWELPALSKLQLCLLTSVVILVVLKSSFIVPHIPDAIVFYCSHH